MGVAPPGARASDFPTEPAAAEVLAEARPVPRLGFTLLGGLGVPACWGGSCYGTFSPAASLQALVLYQPHPSWAVGLAGQIERLHWEATEHSMLDGTPYHVESDLIAGFAGLAGRFMPLPELFVTPVVQMAVGLGFQEVGFSYGCEHGARPTAQLALGGRARISSSAFVFAMASARAAIPAGCSVSDAPNVPFAAWQFAFQFGASFDVALGHAAASPPP
jgi:hypothetical protein